MYARLITGQSYRVKGFRFRNTGNILADFREIDKETATYLDSLNGVVEVLEDRPTEYLEYRDCRPPALLRINLTKLRYWQSGRYRWAPDHPTNMVPVPTALELMKSGNFISADPRLNKAVFKDVCGGLHLEWKGIINPHDGYGLSSIKVIEGLHRAGVKLSVYSHGYHQPRGQGEIVTSLLASTFKERCKWGVLYGQPPGFGDLRTPRRIGFTMFETSGIPEGWAARCNEMDRIWVASQFCKEVFEKEGVTVPVESIPLGYDDEAFYYRPRPKNKVFTFFIAANLSERKNARAALRAFRDVFKKNEAVKFVVWPGIFEHLGTTAQDLKEFEADGRIEIKRFNYSSEEFRAQLWQSDCFVFPTHGEGFGIPPVEAMACGVPVIVTDWSGCTEYTDPRYNYPLKIAGFSESKDQPKYYRGKWADPDEKHLRYLMRHVFSHQETSEKKAKAGAKWIKKFAVKNIIPQMVEALERADKEIKQ